MWVHHGGGKGAWGGVVGDLPLYSSSFSLINNPAVSAVPLPRCPAAGPGVARLAPATRRARGADG